MQTIARFYEPWKAYVVCGRLWSEDIPAFIAFEFITANQWLEVIAFGGVRLYVPDGSEDEARAVLRRADAGAYREELEYELGPLPQIRCPHCGASDYRKTRPLVLTALAVLFALWTYIPIPPRGRKLRCRVCKTVWRPDAETTTPGSL